MSRQAGPLLPQNANLSRHSEGAKTLETTQLYHNCGIMERVWEELRKIESQAEQIRNEARDEAKKITILAQQEAEKLVANSKTYAEEEAHRLYTDTIQEANRSRDEQLKTNRESTEKLRVQAEKRMEKASSAIVNALLEETIY